MLYKNKRRLGFSLVEVVFGSVIAVMLFGVFWNIYYSQTSTSHKLTKKNEALRSAQLASEILQKDFKQIVSVEIERNSDGTINRKYGDHTAPVKVSPGGKSVSFYIPAETSGAATPQDTSGENECYTVIYSMVPSAKAGIYRIKRTVIKKADEVSNIDDGVSEELPGKILKSVYVKDVTYHLLDPKAPAPVYRSPDTNYYLQAVVAGTDQTGAETMTANVLVSLEYPSVMQMTQNIQEVIKYRPVVPLVTAPDTFVATAEEQNTINEIDSITEQFTNGNMSAADYEDKITELINRHAGETNGPVIGSSGNIIPHIDRLTIAAPVAPGRPVILSAPGGQAVVVPPPAPGNSEPGSTGTEDEGGNNVHWSSRTMVLDSNGQVRFMEEAEGGGNNVNVDFSQMLRDVDASLNNQMNNAMRYVNNNLTGNGNVSN